MYDPITFRGKLAHIDPSARMFAPVLCLRPELVEVHEGARIDSFVKIEGGRGVYVGPHVHIGSMAHVNIGGGRVILEYGSVVGPGAKIVAGTNTPMGISMSVSAPQELQYIQRDFVILKRLSFVATGAIVLPRVTLGEGAVLAAGSVAVKDVPPWEIWGGSPAIKIRDRDRECFMDSIGLDLESWLQEHPPDMHDPKVTGGELWRLGPG